MELKMVRSWLRIFRDGPGSSFPHSFTELIMNCILLQMMEIMERNYGRQMVLKKEPLWLKIFGMEVMEEAPLVLR